MNLLEACVPGKPQKLRRNGVAGWNWDGAKLTYDDQAPARLDTSIIAADWTMEELTVEEYVRSRGFERWANGEIIGSWFGFRIFTPNGRPLTLEQAKIACDALEKLIS